MKIDGFWFFEGEEIESVRSVLREPSVLVQVVPDMHHLVKLSPVRYLFVLQPSAAVLGVQELTIAVDLDEASGEEDLSFAFAVEAAGETAMNGTGRISLRAAVAGTQMTYELEGEQSGPLGEISDFLMETQARAALRQLSESIGRLLRGEITQGDPAAADTSREVMLAVVGGVLALLVFAWWLGRRRRSDGQG